MKSLKERVIEGTKVRASGEFEIEVYFEPTPPFKPKRGRKKRTTEPKYWILRQGK